MMTAGSLTAISGGRNRIPCAAETGFFCRSIAGLAVSKSVFRACLLPAFLSALVVMLPANAPAQVQEALLVYGSTNNPGTPISRIWFGSSWSLPSAALSV